MVAGLLAAMLVIEPNNPLADVAGIPQAEMSAYREQPHFKALAISPALTLGAPLVRYAFNYDTPKEALLAALAYCADARRSAVNPDQWAQCSAVEVGSYPVAGLDADHLDAVLARYLDETVAALRRLLDQTNDRAVRTSLTTILHKAGRYAESEALLVDLAVAGEDLARNALAYHWAELNIHLERALAYADSAVASRPDWSSFHDTHGLVLYRLGHLGDARRAAERAVSLQPHPIVLDHYGDILWASGQRDEAVRAWQHALSGSQEILRRQRIEHKISFGPTGPPVFE